MKWLPLGLSMLSYAAGFALKDDTLIIMGTIWMATAVVLASIQRKA